MSTKRQNELAQIKSALGNIRRLSDRVLSLDDDDDAVEPDLFEQLSRAAAEIAELERTRRRKRRERALAVSRQVSEFFPDMAEKAAAFARFGDDGLDRAAIAIQLAIEANDRLAASDSDLRGALDRQDYGGVRDHAGRAREHQAAVAAQKDILAALLAPLSDGGGDIDPPDRPGPRQEPADDNIGNIAAHRPTESEPSFARVGRSQRAAEYDPALTSSEPGFAPAPTFKDEAVADTSLAVPIGDGIPAASSPRQRAASAEPAGKQFTIPSEGSESDIDAEAGGAERESAEAAAAAAADAVDNALVVIRNGLIIPEPLARKSEDPKFSEELTKRIESARERVRARFERDGQEAGGGLLTKLRRGRAPGNGMSEEGAG